MTKAAITNLEAIFVYMFTVNTRSEDLPVFTREYPTQENYTNPENIK